MKRRAPLEVSYILRRLLVDCDAGRVYWKDATKHHRNLVGKEAGCCRPHHSGKKYWIVKIDGIPYRRAQLILTVLTGVWPKDTVDHMNGDSLDDRAANLRHATTLQNAWNHKKRKRGVDLPMGIRRLSSGRYQARLVVNKRMNYLGAFATLKEAVAVYKRARTQHFGEFA